MVDSCRYLQTSMLRTSHFSPANTQINKVNKIHDS